MFVKNKKPQSPKKSGASAYLLIFLRPIIMFKSKKVTYTLFGTSATENEFVATTAPVTLSVTVIFAVYIP